MRSLSLLLVLFGLSVIIRAQTERHTGFMSDSTPDAEYVVTLAAGETVNALTVATSGDLDTVLGLKSPDGELIVQNDDRDTTTLNSFISYAARTPGDYVIVVSNIRETSGDYVLSIDVETADVQQTVYSDTLSDDTPDHEYHFNLDAGQTIMATATRLSGNLDPVLALQGQDGAMLAENDDRDSSTLDAHLSYTAMEAGEYAIIVSNIRKTSGDFQLTVQISDSLLADAESYTGYMGDDVADDEYPMSLKAGEAVIITLERISGDLDTFLILNNDNEERIAQNDDRNLTSLDSQLAYISNTGGDYTVVVSNIRETSGDYRLTINRVTPEEAAQVTRVELSGAALAYDTEHFRIHYTLEGDDATTQEYVEAVAETMEQVRDIQINQLGWAAPPNDGIAGGDSRYDVYIVELMEKLAGGDLGVAYSEFPAGDNPNTDVIEDAAAPSYILLDDDYAEAELDDHETPMTVMRATAAHEYHHAVQYGYDYGEDHRWYFEATAVWMETVTFPDEQDATGYVTTLFDYPEVCLGVSREIDPTDGILQYGNWLLLESMAQEHGPSIVPQLWENISYFESWEPLRKTLATYGETIPEAVVRYHMRNLMRDYDLTPFFNDARLWLEAIIDKPGSDWTFTGEGIQELGANFFKLEVSPDVYHISIDNRRLELWAFGIKGKEAAAFSLGQGGSVDLRPYQTGYLMVFNPEYGSISACEYSDYTLTVTPSTEATVSPTMALDASQFIELE